MAKEYQRKVYTDNKVTLCRTISCESEAILIYLENERIFRMEDSDLVRGKLPNRMAASNYLLEIVATRTRGYDGMMKILKELNQDGAYEILQKGKLDNEPESEIGQQPHAELSSNSTSTRVPTEEKEPLKRKRLPEDEGDGPKRFKGILQRPDKVMNFEDDKCKLPPKGKGLFIAVNVITYENDDPRHSAKIDTKELASTFSSIGYEVYNEGNILEKEHWTAEGIKETFEKFRERANQPDVLSIVVFVGGHGKHGKVFGSDGKPVLIWKDILDKFNTKNCMELQNKPKLFFFETCQKFEDEEDDKRERPYLPNFDNYGLVIATIPGFAAIRNTNLGSVMVHFLTEAIRKNARCWSFQKIIEAVQIKVQQYVYNPKEEDVAAGKFIGAQTIDPQLAHLKTLYFNLDPKPQ